MNQDKKEQALQRVFAVTGCRTQVELAELLGVKQSSISDAKRRNVVPAEWLVRLLRLKGISPEWILTGTEPRFLGPAEGIPKTNTVYVTDIKPPAECSAQELVTELVRRALTDL